MNETQRTAAMQLFWFVEKRDWYMQKSNTQPQPLFYSQIKKFGWINLPIISKCFGNECSSAKDWSVFFFYKDEYDIRCTFTNNCTQIHWCHFILWVHSQHRISMKFSHYLNSLNICRQLKTVFWVSCIHFDSFAIC